jgi:hypothetical protein
MARRGRPQGSVVRLLDDPGRFEVAAWLGFTELGLKPYPAAYLTHFLITADRPITTESIDGVLLKSSTAGPANVIGHADRIRRKAPEAIGRADDRERKWLTSSAALIVAVVQFTAAGDQRGLTIALARLREAGWTAVLSRIGARIEASLRSNFPPAKGPISRAARQLLRDVTKKSIG